MEEERISKIMARRGMCSRREAEAYIADGRVTVNGVTITEMGVKAPLDADIKLDANGIKTVTVILNKPLGYVSNLPQNGQKEAKDLLIEANRVDKGPPVDINSLHVIGRLDINSKGLLILSSDGRVAKEIIGPDSEVEKEYIVRFDAKVPQGAIEKLKFGLRLDGKQLKRAQVKRNGDQALIIVLREGKKRQIRRMCELVGLNIISLKRVRVGSLQLNDLPKGKWKVIDPDF